MNCYTCATREDAVTAAVAVCSVCGAGMCVEHATVGNAYVEEHSPGSPSTHTLPGRRMLCVICAPASTIGGLSPAMAGRADG